MAGMIISIPDGLKGWAEQRVAEERYGSARDDLRDLMRRDRRRRGAGSAARRRRGSSRH